MQSLGYLEHIKHDHIYEVVVFSVEDPTNIKEWSVSINGQKYKGACGKPGKLIGAGIHVLFDAGIERPESEVDDRGFLRFTGASIRDNRWAVNILRDLSDPSFGVTGALPVGGVVLSDSTQQKIDRLNSMTVEELKKMALESGYPARVCTYANKTTLVKLLS